MSKHDSDTPPPVTVRAFRRRFHGLVLFAWAVSPAIGLAFILFIGMLSGEQVIGILTTPLEPLYIAGTLILAVGYFRRFAKPLEAFLLDPMRADRSQVFARMRSFPLVFWGIFIAYMLSAPASVIISAE